MSTLDIAPTSGASPIHSHDVLVEPWGSTLLLVENDPSDRACFEQMLGQIPSGEFHVTHVGTVAAAVQALRGQDFSVVLLDLTLPEMPALAAIQTLQSAAPLVPVVVLGNWEDQRLALQAVRAGAHDFLMKRDIVPADLGRSLRYAIERKCAEGRLAHLANYDQLTQLPNRALFQDRLQQALTRSELDAEQVALMQLVVESFDEIRDAYGTEVAERLLKTLASRLQGAVRGTETVARLNGAEFCIVFELVQRVEDVEAVARRALAAIAEPFDGVPVQLTARVGIALSRPGDRVEGLLERAESAMLRARPEGRKPIRVSTQADDTPAPEQVRAAFARNEFRLVYQPRLNIDRGNVTAVEALVRWDHPGRGLLSPCDFIDAVDDAGLMPELGDWIVFEAAKQARRWWRVEQRSLRISINLSACQFMQVDLAGRLTAIVSDADAQTDWFELEFAESILMDDTARSRTVLQRLQAAGFRTGIDDFGSGLGNLAELAQLPLDVLKIDRSVINELNEFPARRALVAAVVAMGRELALEVVAEGVEQDAQVKMLRDIGASTVQGFWFAQPKSAQACAQWIAGRDEEG